MLLCMWKWRLEKLAYIHSIGCYNGWFLSSWTPRASYTHPWVATRACEVHIYLRVDQALLLRPFLIWFTGNPPPHSHSMIQGYFALFHSVQCWPVTRCPHWTRDDRSKFAKCLRNRDAPWVLHQNLSQTLSPTLSPLKMIQRRLTSQKKMLQSLSTHQHRHCHNLTPVFTPWAWHCRILSPPQVLFHMYQLPFARLMTQRRSMPSSMNASKLQPPQTRRSSVRYYHFSFMALTNFPVEHQMAMWTSQVYQHFKMPLAIAVKNGKVIYVYTCIAYVSYSK